jgi:alkylation response protein AidB-like acyl-CoA dehydrogenase
MDIKLNEQQIEISRQARRFCENETPIEAHVRAMFEDERGFTDEVWGKMAEMGWLGMCIPEDFDGLGMELTDLCVVQEEFGRSVVPGPFFSTVMLFGEALIAAGSDEQKRDLLPKMAAGELLGTLALYETEGGADPGYIQMEAKAKNNGYVLNGSKAFVLDAHVADCMVVPARTTSGDNPSNGVTLFLVDPKTEGLFIEPLPTMDGTRKLAMVSFSDVRATGLLGRIDQGWGPLLKALQRASVGLCAESLGGAQKAMEMAIEYAKERIQFDQPIASYQSIKHYCSQMYIEVESARSVLYWAAWAQDHTDDAEAALAASTAKSYLSDVYRNTAATAIQILGGTGFAWEHDIHLYIKRSKANEIFLGDPAWHRERIMTILGA